MKSIISPTYKNRQKELANFVQNFDSRGKDFDIRDRNSIKTFSLDQKTVNIKSFKVPNFVNRIAYKFFRSSKAERSYLYAHKLLELGILTPYPIAYFEEQNLLFNRSFYISEHLEYDLSYRELAHPSPYQGNEYILRAFARFTYELHEKGIHFIDHSPGNTLIVLKENGYDFYLVDLNRMEFGEMDYTKRIANFKKLSHRKEDITIMADEYASVSGLDKSKVYTSMLKEVNEFQTAFHKKRRLKRRLKFWKS